MDFVTIVLSIAIFQGILLGFVLLKSPFFKNKATKYLAFAIFSLSYSLLNYTLDGISTYQIFKISYVIDLLDISFLFPCFLLLYVITQVHHPWQRLNFIIWILFFYLLSLSISILSSNLPFKLGFCCRIPSSIIDFLEVVNFFISVSIIIGTITFTKIAIRFSKSLQEKKWLVCLWALTLTIFGSWIMAVFLGFFIDYELEVIIKIIVTIAAMLIYWICYFGVYKFNLSKNQKEIAALIERETNPIGKNIIKEPIANKPIDNFNKDNVYYKKLERLCIDEKIYKNRTLDRNKMAEILGISPSYVSQLVNTVTGDNFSNYINGHRVEAVKKLLQDSKFDQYSLLSIGIECGFSSKTTFYNAFKKKCKMTPNAYRNKCK